MARHRFARMLATAALVGATSLGIVVGTAGTSQALDWGPTDRAAVKVLADGFLKGGVRAATPGVMARLESRCLASGPAVLGCTAGVAAVGVGMWYAIDTAPTWIPWLIDKAAENSITGTTVQNGCASLEWAASLDQLMKNGSTVLVSDVKAAGSVIGRYLNGGTGSSTCYAGFKYDAECIGPAGDVRTITDAAPSTAQTKTFTAAAPTSTWNLNYWDTCGSTAAVRSITIRPTVFTAGTDISEGPANGLKYVSGQPAGTGQTSSRVQCKRPDGSSYEVNSSSLPKDGYVTVAHCDPGDTPVGMDVSQIGDRAAPSTHIDLAIPPSDWANYPKCVTAADGVQEGCVYRVIMDDRPCEVGRYDCVHWSEIARISPERVECHFGPYVMPLDACKMLERSYSLTSDSYIITRKNTDGDPVTWDPPSPDVYDPGNPSANPTVSPSPTSNPSSSPSPTPQVTVTASPEPTVTVTAPPVTQNCSTPYHLGAVQPVTARGVNYLAPLYDIHTVGGVRPDIIPDHPSGLAADFMIDGDMMKGDQLSEHARVKASTLGIQYIIWNQHIWNIDRDSEGWRFMEDRGSLTANHKDHVHITFKDVVPGVCNVDPGDDPKEESCWARNVGLDPGTWVIGPLKCLFIPQKTLNSRTGEIVAVINVKGPGRLFDKVKEIGAGFNTGSGCKGPNIPFKLSQYVSVNMDMYPLDACAGAPMETPAKYVKALLTVMISFNGGISIMRAIMAGFGIDMLWGSKAGDEKS